MPQVLNNIDVKILSAPLFSAEAELFVADDDSGGIVSFIGTVRRHTAGKAVLRLEFEAFETMALKEMTRIAEEILAGWPARKIAIHHRTGTLEIGEIAVVIAVSAAHRQAAFEACRYAIDTLKQTVPIWKREVFADGAVWVAAHP
jgi:molybdopterin synthase catalytic subunit